MQGPRSAEAVLMEMYSEREVVPPAVRPAPPEPPVPVPGPASPDTTNPDPEGPRPDSGLIPDAPPLPESPVPAGSPLPLPEGPAEVWQPVPEENAQPPEHHPSPGTSLDNSWFEASWSSSHTETATEGASCDSPTVLVPSPPSAATWTTALYALVNGFSKTELSQQCLWPPKSSAPRQVARSGADFSMATYDQGATQEMTERQRNNPNWSLPQKYRLTASNFGCVLDSCRHRARIPDAYSEDSESDVETSPERHRDRYPRHIRPRRVPTGTRGQRLFTTTDPPTRRDFRNALIFVDRASRSSRFFETRDVIELWLLENILHVSDSLPPFRPSAKLRIFDRVRLLYHVELSGWPTALQGYADPSASFLLGAPLPPPPATAAAPDRPNRPAGRGRGCCDSGSIVQK
ncbi:hypothetical protein HPB47_019571 [Ixodes persulcatus]|uniref:Uncharacterized protein n=1 Tax=Ixodes persulcatus TaxID=34615 RepID=A0AC60QI26_IXOPE|nr:hypothetical protein HPB47_019571 [Ixodes persulcatus]